LIKEKEKKRKENNIITMIRSLSYQVSFLLISAKKEREEKKKKNKRRKFCNISIFAIYYSIKATRKWLGWDLSKIVL